MEAATRALVEIAQHQELSPRSRNDLARKLLKKEKFKALPT